MCWGRGGGLWYFPLINQHLLRGGQKKNPEIIRGGFKKMKGKNKEIIIAHPLDKLWMLPKRSLRLVETAEIQASLQSSLFSRLVEDGDQSPLWFNLGIPCDFAFFSTLCAETLPTPSPPPPYFVPKPNLSKTLKGLLMRLVIFENTIFQLNSLNITVSVCYVSGSKVNK